MPGSGLYIRTAGCVMPRAYSNLENPIIMSKNKKRIKLIYNVVIFTLIAVGCVFTANHFMHVGKGTFTDNAQIRKNIVPVNVRIQGYVEEIRFKEYSEVKKGDTLALITDAEYRLRVAQAEAAVANARAAMSIVGKSIATAKNGVEVAQAAIEESEVRLENARDEYERYERLYAEESVTKQQYDNIRTQYEVALTSYERCVLQKKSAELTVDELNERLSQNSVQIELAEASLRLAELDLSYTVITAPCNGTTGKKQIVEGQLVQPGQALVSIVDGDEVWVVANYRERQLKHIRPGDRVSVSADAVPGIEYEGVVETVSDATGAAYSIFPQDNATGNFVKTEQRIPVRILLRNNPPEAMSLLRAGMNVECTI